MDGALRHLRAHAAILLFAGLVLAVTIAFREVLVPFFLAIFIVYLIEPLVARMAAERWRGRSVPRWAAVVTVYATCLALASGVAAMMLPRLGDELQRIAQDAPRSVQEFRATQLPVVNRWLESRLGGVLDRDAAPSALRAAHRAVHGAVDEAAQRAAVATAMTVDETARFMALRPPVTVSSEPSENPSVLLKLRPLDDGSFEVLAGSPALRVERVRDGVYRMRADEDHETDGGRFDLEKALVGSVEHALEASGAQVTRFVELGQKLVSRLLGAVMTGFVALMVAAFLSIDSPAVIRFILNLFPAASRPRMDRLLVELDRGLAGVIRGQLMICLVNGVLTTIGLVMLKVPFALTLGLIAAVLSLIPIFGTILSTIPSVFLGLTVNVSTGFLVLGWILLIHFIEANMLNPKIIGTSARIHPVIVVFALLAGEHSFGLMGALLAVPVASILQTLFLFVRNSLMRDEAVGPGEGNP